MSNLFEVVLSRKGFDELVVFLDGTDIECAFVDHPEHMSIYLVQDVGDSSVDWFLSEGTIIKRNDKELVVYSPHDALIFDFS